MRKDRLHVTVSAEMTVALEMLARRSGLGVATQAMVVLRQALDRTIASAECQEALRERRKLQTVAEWREDVQAERFVENRMPRREAVPERRNGHTAERQEAP